MEIVVTKDYNEMSQTAASYFQKLISRKPNAVLGLATGSTPIGLYQELIKLNRQGLDFSKLTTFNLDEYFGLEASNPQSYHYFMQEQLFDHVNIKPENIHIPSGDPATFNQQLKQYDAKIEQTGGIDIQVLGIGSNGHIAFNEPANQLNLHTSLVKLTPSTIKDNARFFRSESEVPTQAISMGIGSIFKAKQILILASGKNKHLAVKFLKNGRFISTQMPVSLLQLHPKTILIVDEAAYKG